MLKGNLAPEGCVVKRSAVAPEMMRHQGPARVFNSEEEAIEAIYAGKIRKGDVVVIDDNFGIRITEILQKPDINVLTQG